jgi:hypothetical protein
MPHTDIAFSSVAVLADRPICPHCDNLMWLVRIVSLGAYMSERTFECPTCEVAQTIDVKQKLETR